jgi:multiple sugar transport system permease protein
MSVPAQARLASQAKAPKGGIGTRSETVAGYLFIAVPMLLFIVLNIGAIVYAIYISVWKWNIRLGPTSFAGIQNYQSVLTNPTFQVAIRNTIYYTILWVPLTMVAGLFLAVIVNQKIRGQTFFRAAFYFPAIASSAAITVLWIFLVAPDGFFNEIRAALGLNPLFHLFGYADNQNWIGNQGTAMQSVVILNAWTTSGTFMLFYLASLQSISRDIYEAAAIDGASAWQTFRRVTFPLLRPGHYFVATVAVIGGLQLFDQAFIGGSINGDPNNSLMTMVLFIYRATFGNDSDFSVAAAAGVVLFIVIMSATLVQRRLFGQAPSW